jgi:hypothetical protein
LFSQTFGVYKFKIKVPANLGAGAGSLLGFGIVMMQVIYYSYQTLWGTGL